MSNQAELLSPAEVLALIERAEWQKLDETHRGGVTASLSKKLIGQFNGTHIHLNSKYAEDGPGGLPTVYYSATILRMGTTIGEISASYGTHGYIKDRHHLKELYDKHLAAFTVTMVSKAP